MVYTAYRLPININNDDVDGDDDDNDDDDDDDGLLVCTPVQNASAKLADYILRSVNADNSFRTLSATLFCDVVL